jgi:tetratricopeptide (TPR) repeat protein
MAVSVLTDSQTPADFFRRRILLNTQYWRNYIGDKAKDIAVLDGERELIIKAITFALDLTDAWPLVYDLLISFAPYMERRGYWEIWNHVLRRAVQVAECNGNDAQVVSLSALLARLLLRQSYFKEAVNYYRRTIRSARQIGDHFNEARACSNLGYHYVDKGHWYRAEVLCCHALSLFEEMDSDHGRAHTENHLGLLYIWLGLWDQAHRRLERACAIWQAMGDQHGLMHGFVNLGLLHVKMGHPTQALAYSTKALHQAEITGEELELGKIYMNMGLAYVLQGEFNQAKKYTYQAETIFQRFLNMPGLADVRENWGVIYLAQQKWPKAIEYLESALQTWQALNNRHDELQTIIHLGNCELTRGNHRQAKVWLKKAEHLLSQYPYAGKYCQLQLQIENFRHGLIKQTIQPAVAECQSQEVTTG